ncbi:MAG TPA: TonB-dependent receptor, partial [Candidatus Acidoferrales bacterium]|nr:TonB-dependent receptor [Candidatus Acidoferrales bacterium]
PDLLASSSEVQVQRGVGPALYGAASLGGSVNVETGSFSATPAFSVTTSAGSFGTRRVSVAGATPAGASGWQLDGRYSRIETDGYRDQSWSRLWSYEISARRSTATQQWTAHLFGGPENTHLAYLGTPPEYLDGSVTGNVGQDRRWNALSYPGEQDHYFEPHYELVHSWAPSDRLALTQTFFYFDGSGYYDEQRDDQALTDYHVSPWTTTDSTLLSRDHYALNSSGFFTRDSLGRVTVVNADIVRRRYVANQHFGWVPRLRIGNGASQLTVGGEARFHDGHHLGTLVSGSGLPEGISADQPYYDFRARTFSAGLFVREQWDVRSSLRLTGDLAWRHQAYDVLDDKFDGIHFTQTYDLGLPRIGLQWQPDRRWSVFASWAYAAREPALRDLYDGESPGALPLYRVVDVAAGIYQDPLIRPEHVLQEELGAQWRGRGAAASADLYRMDFHDEIVDAGQYNTDLGYPILGNAAQSVHQGLELAANAARRFGAVRGELAGNATLSDNHFVHYTEVWGPSASDDIVDDGHAEGFSPATMANLTARASWAGYSAALETQSVGRIYVDNSETGYDSIAPHTVENLELSARRVIGGANAELSLRILNLGDLRYDTDGYVDVDPFDASRMVPWLTPAATRNWLASVKVAW